MSQSHVERANDLLSRMTLTEKVQQLSSIRPEGLFGVTGLDDEALQLHLSEGIGHISMASSMGTTGVQIASAANGIQKFLVEHTRLGIPAMLHAEALNGLVAPGYTSFPTAIGLAATWDPDRVKVMADVIRQQMRSLGILQALSPVLDVARDARWGRVHETYGEDVYLVTAFSVAFVQGIQGRDLEEGILATGKHFLGYALTEAGQNMAATHLGERELYDVYATPFEAAIKLADLGSVMNSYSEIDGVPVGASREILTDLLRGRLGFSGSVVSDYTTIEWLHTRQNAAASIPEAGELALHAGIDVELPVPSGYKTLEASIRAGRVSVDTLDDAVRRVLLDKFKVGLFENPYASTDEAILLESQSRGDDLSRTLADESVTLLKNNGVLPLPKRGRIAVIGPHANSAMVNFAAYTYPAMIDMMKGFLTGDARMAGVSEPTESLSDEAASVAAAEFARLMQTDTEDVAREAYGTVPLVDAIRAAAPGAQVQFVEGVGVQPDDPQDLDAVVSLAKEADVVVLAIGGKAGWFATRITEGEGTDAAQVELPAHQVALVRAVNTIGTPAVAVVYQGRPLALTEIEPWVDAILTPYYPGPHGGNAIAAAIFGDTNPSGKLPYSMPRGTGQVPLYASQKRGSGYRRSPDDMLQSYVDLELTPLFPFGHGLSYSAFEYGDMTLQSNKVPLDNGVIVATVELRNTSVRDGEEVIQLYASQTAKGMTRPEQQLIGFKRASVPAGESVSIQFTVRTSQLGYSGIDKTFILEPGLATLSAGGSSASTPASAHVELVGETINLEGRRSYLSAAQIV